jgi:hypothetical protein
LTFFKIYIYLKTGGKKIMTVRYALLDNEGNRLSETSYLKMRPAILAAFNTMIPENLDVPTIPLGNLSQKRVFVIVEEADYGRFKNKEINLNELMECSLEKFELRFKDYRPKKKKIVS